MDEDIKIIVSPLSRKYVEDNKTVDIKIYDSGEEEPGRTGWVLEIEDEYGNSTVYDDFFKSDKEALEQFLSDVKKEGIDVFIGKPPFNMQQK
jgi:uncharacterized protein